MRTPGSPPSFDRWSPELRRAVMLARPEFFAMSPEEQLRYRVKLPGADREAIIAALLREHGERRPEALAKLESRGRISIPLQNRINEWIQPLEGIGEDAFSFNGNFAKTESILDFETLLAYDRHDYAFQQEANQEQFEGYVPEPYTGTLHGDWARAMIDGQLWYLTLSMASWHLFGRVEQAARVEIEARIPHRLVPGPEDGKRGEDGSVRWDMRVDAGGQEALLDELERRVYEEADRRRLELGQRFHEEHQGVCFFIDAPFPHEPPEEHNLLVVFSDPSALAEVHFASFLPDCRRIERPLSELHALETREVEHIREFAQEQHEDLVRNFDPTVVPLRKRWRVMVHSQAVRGLEDEDLP